MALASSLNRALCSAFSRDGDDLIEVCVAGLPDLGLAAGESR
jgi:hypothetical protein